MGTEDNAVLLCLLTVDQTSLMTSKIALAITSLGEFEDPHSVDVHLRRDSRDKK